MIYLGFIALIPAGFVAVLAISKKTSPSVRKAAIIALIIIGITFISCTIILLFMFGVPAGKSAARSDFSMDTIKAVEKNYLPVIIAAVAIFIFLIWLIVLAIREQRRNRK